MAVGLLTCVRGEGVQGVLTLFCIGAAQVCHDDRVVELKEQLEVEEEDGDRQEEKEEVESGEASQGECAMLMTMDGDMKCAQNLSHECAMSSLSVEQRCACSLSACTPRVR